MQALNFFYSFVDRNHRNSAQFTVGFVRSIEKMEFHVYYYPILILFLANFASAILQLRQKDAFEDLFGTDFG